jgi:murein DD-endopeptidase MepM/ murein hydrolase activator NlpD
VSIVSPLPRGPYADGKGTMGGWPISSWFGGRPNPFTGSPSWHGGMDLVAPRGTPMIATEDGRVSQGWDSSGGGNWSTLYADSGRRWGYGHALRYEPGVNGARVRAGDVIAYVDSTGASTGDHLHIAMSPTPQGPWQDPFDLLASAVYAGDAQLPTIPTPDPVAPQHPTPDPKEALVALQFWQIKDDPQFYAVGLSDSLIGAVDKAGAPAGPEHLVGGVYAYAFDNPATFALVAGAGIAPIVLDPKDTNHKPLVDALRALPLVYQGR